MNIAGVEIDDAQPVAGGDICQAWRGTTGGGRRVFAKRLPGAPDGFFHVEADRLQWLSVPDGPPLPRVVAVDDEGLVIEEVEPAGASRAAAEGFGRALAAMHRAQPPMFGHDQAGFIGSVPLPNDPCPEWPTFYVERRIEPFLFGLAPEQRRDIEHLCAHIVDVAGPPEPPARLHGDLWSGNVLWARDGRAWLVDAAAAHGGHRETDLAMLALFGAPHLDTIVAAYAEASPLADGWRQRVRLHQLHPLLVHAQLFGGAYGVRAAAAARAALT